MRKLATLSAVGVILSLAGAASAQVVRFGFAINALQEVPSNPSPATGSGNAVLDVAANTVQLDFSFSGLTSTQTAAHIHQAAPGVNGPIIVPLPTGSPVSGLFALTPPQTAAMLAGNTYVNAHTTMFPGGEIRGNLTKLYPVDVPMSGAQENPPNNSTAVGSASVTLNTFTNQVFLHMEFSGLSSPQDRGTLSPGRGGRQRADHHPAPHRLAVDGTFSVTDAQEAAPHRRERVSQCAHDDVSRRGDPRADHPHHRGERGR